MSKRTCTVVLPSGEVCNRPHDSHGYCGGHSMRVKRTGDPQAHIPIEPPLRYESPICSVETCPNPRWAKGYCTGHYTRFRKTGDPQTDVPLIDLSARGEQSPEWKGDAITSPKTMHSRLQRVRGKASDHLCVDCGNQAYDWSHKDGCPDERITGTQHWCTHVECFEPRCRPDHMAYDEERSQRKERARQAPRNRVYFNQEYCKGGHPLSGDNLYIYPSGERACRKCRRSWDLARDAAIRKAKETP